MSPYTIQDGHRDESIHGAGHKDRKQYKKNEIEN